VKVAVIASSSDLGSVPSLFAHAQDYAKFLGVELSFIYEGPLLVVMPTAFGFVDEGHTVAQAAATLSGLPIRSSSADDLTLAAAQAVNGLESAHLLHYKDSFAPEVYAAPASVAAVRRLALRYQVWDDSGRAKVDLEILNEHKLTVARIHVPVRSVTQCAWYFVVWRAPRSLAHTVLSYCAQATDPAGNRAKRFCTRLTIT
jgi:hypothetical protein